MPKYHLPFTSRHYEALYKYNIASIDDFNKITTHDLHIICQQYYYDTMKAYYILKDNGVVFQAWEDQYLFELLSGKIAQKISRKYRIDTIAELRSCSANPKIFFNVVFNPPISDTVFIKASKIKTTSNPLD